MQEAELPDIVVYVVLIAIGSHLSAKGECCSFPGIANCRPLLQWTVDSYTVAVYLVTTTYHDMEWLLLMYSQDIIPQGWPGPKVLVYPNGEAIAGMEHYPEGVGGSGNHKRSRMCFCPIGEKLHVGYCVLPACLE